MSGMIEKLAKAARTQIPFQMKEGYEERLAETSEAVVRAVLAVLREPSEDAGWVGARIIQGPIGGSAKVAAMECFTAMIDAILNES